MNEIFNQISELFESFKTNNEKAVAGNKSAATRARKDALAIKKLIGDYRKVSVEETKTKKDA